MKRVWVQRAASVLVLAATTAAQAATFTWDGGGTDNFWQTDANWNPDGKPATDGTATLAFSGNTRNAAANNFTENTVFAGINLMNDGTSGKTAAFTLSGTSLTLGSNIPSTAASAAITLDEILDLFYSLKSPYRKKAAFIMNDSTVKAIRKLKDNNGQYLWQPSIKEATPDTIINRPLYTSAYMPVIEAGAKSIVFGDFSYYWVADRQGRVFKRLNELYAATGQVGFIATQRVDGKLVLPESIKILQQKA